jgi:predicted TIM-barrel fold metal-dependent hydrolase
VLAGSLVVDAVVHPYNLSDANRDSSAAAQLEAVYAAHVLATGKDNVDHVLSREEFFSDFPFTAIAQALFVESPVDFAIIHSLPSLGFCHGYVTDPDRAAEFRDRHPHRFAVYATVDSADPDTAIKQLTRQVEELGVDGLKLYPAFFYAGEGHGWRMDADDFATPLLEAAQGLGLRNIAVHKALWLPPAPRSAFDIDDLSSALERFADLNIYMVHAGTALTDQTCELLRRHDNFYATLESSFAYLVVRPDVFATTLAQLLKAGGSRRLLFASGANLSHPGPMLAAFDGYELPQAVLDEIGCSQLTDDDRHDILGRNALRLHGLDEAEIVGNLLDDEFSTARLASPEPWSAVRSHGARLR